MKREEAIVGALLVLFACRAVLASAIVPPWQGPDETVHFVLAQLLSQSDGNLPGARTILERQVLQSMGKHHWWEPYGGRTPDPLPESFELATRRLGVGVYSQPLYYGLGAALLRIAPSRDVEGAYWRLRLLSIALCATTLAVGWSGTRLLFGPTVAVGSTAIAALHPQFVLTAISVNSDALVILLGTLMWWLVACVVSRRRTAMSFLLILAASAATLLTKRSAVAVAATAAVLAAASLATAGMRHATVRTIASTAIVVMIGAAILAIGWTTFEGLPTQLGSFWRDGLLVRRAPAEMTLSQVLTYGRISTDYAWLIGGWLRFPAPEPWLWITRTLTVMGFAGAVVLLLTKQVPRSPLAIAWLFVIVQAGTVIAWGFLTLSSPQGRYLFPVIAPATALLWLGLTRLTPARFQRYAPAGVVSVLAILDVTGFTTVLIPAYLPWG